MIILGVLDKDNSYNCLRHRGKQEYPDDRSIVGAGHKAGPCTDEKKMTNMHVCPIYQNKHNMHPSQIKYKDHMLYCTVFVKGIVENQHNF